MVEEGMKYDRFYFENHCGQPYERNPTWLAFFHKIANQIIEEIGPHSTLDVGCAWGFLVESLRNQGVDAYGMDVSGYAIAKVIPEVKPFCWVGSIIDPLPRKYDLITAIEVFEHISKDDVETAIRNMCSFTDDIIFSSTPFDYQEVTHTNVQPPDYWAQLFAKQGFFRDVSFDASFITSWCIRFRRAHDPIHKIIGNYERQFWPLSKERDDLRIKLVEADQIARESSRMISEMRDEALHKEEELTTLRDSTIHLQEENEKIRIEVEQNRMEQEKQEIINSEKISLELEAVNNGVQSLNARIRELEHHTLILENQNKKFEYELGEVYISKTWKIASVLRNIRVKVFPPNNWLLRAIRAIKKFFQIWKIEGYPSAFRAIKRKVASQAAIIAPTLHNHTLSPYFESPDMDQWYQNWIITNEPSMEDISRQREEIKRFSYLPIISVIMPVYNPPLNLLKEVIRSIQSQTYETWELCIADASYVEPAVRNFLQEVMASDNRIKAVFLDQNLGISGNSNAALEMATGDFIYLVDHDDLLPPFALYEITSHLNLHPECDILYGDEDRITVSGQRTKPFFKPDWSPDLLTAFMYIGHSTYRKDLILKLSGFRSEFDYSQDYDLALRATELTDKIAHISKVLYHWRMTPASAAAGGKDFARESNIAALRDAMIRRGYQASVIELPTSNCVKYDVPEGEPTVSIIVPTDDVVNAIKSIETILNKTNYQKIEILVVINSEAGRELANRFANDHRIEIIPYDHPYNFSAKCNTGVRFASGTFIIFLNDDVYPREADWIHWLIGPFQDKNIGAVSPKLLYTNGTVQHAGLVTGVRGLFGTAFHTYFRDSTVQNNLLLSPRTVSAATAACLAMRKKDFDTIGGFNEIDTPVFHSDVDLCYRIRERGLRVVYTPYTELDHVGHASLKSWDEKGIKHSEKADIFMLKRWSKYVTYDPYFPTNMRDLLYLDSPENILMFLGSQDSECFTKKDIIAITHDLSLSGAPLVFLRTIRQLRKEGYFVLVISPCKGELLQTFIDENIPIIIDPLMMTEPSRLDAIIKDFDLILANTITTWRFVLQEKIKSKKVLWWIHESEFGVELAEKEAGVREALQKADRVIFPSTQTLNRYSKYNINHNFTSMFYGFDLDETNVISENIPNSPKLKVLQVGSVEYRKGQDITVKAINKIPEDRKDNFEFKFVGRFLKKEYCDGVFKLARNNPSIHWIGQVTPDEAIKYIADCDVVVITSRDDPSPVVIYEALALGKPVITTPVGNAELIHEGVNGYVIPFGDTSKLAEILLSLEGNKQKLVELGNEGRQIYLQNLTASQFLRKFLPVIESV